MNRNSHKLQLQWYMWHVRTNRHIECVVTIQVVATSAPTVSLIDGYIQVGQEHVHWTEC